MKENKKVNVLVVDDSAFMRKVVSDIVESEAGLKVVDTARNGKKAIEKIQELNPDVVTLDIEMPELDGLSTLKRLKSMGIKIPIIMLSSFTTEGSKATLEALELGAVDFVAKPSGPISLDIHNVKDELVEKIKAASNAKVELKDTVTKKSEKDMPEGKDISRAEKDERKNQKKPTPKLVKAEKKGIVAIGSSTGGPRALHEIIPKLPADYPACLIVVQHMPAGFTNLMSERLASLSQLRVKEAEDGEKLEAGKVLIAPGGYHLTLESHGPASSIDDIDFIRVKLDESPPIKGLRPSVDVTLEYISQFKSINKMAVILTGMGSDGAKGVRMIKDSGGQIIVEDESSCVVFGMPRAALKTGVVDKTVALSSMASEIIDRVK